MRRLLMLGAMFVLVGAQTPAPDAVVAEAGDVKITAADVEPAGECNP